MNFTLLPSLDQNFSNSLILSLLTFLSADKMHHLLLNKFAKPASGPLYSVPAIGCEAIQLTFLRFKLLIILLTSFFLFPEPLSFYCLFLMAAHKNTVDKLSHI